MQDQLPMRDVAPLLLLGLLVSAMMFLTFTAAGINLLEQTSAAHKADPGESHAAAALAAENVRIAQLKERLRELRERLAELASRPERTRTASKEVAERLRREIQAEQAAQAKLQHALDQGNVVAVAALYGADADTGERDARYIECRATGALLQPQGQTLPTDDPGRLAEAVAPGKVVVLVRPDGFETFLQVRAALSGAAGIQFGYLPVEADWQLDYHQPAS